jgi:hypothetical protein
MGLRTYFYGDPYPGGRAWPGLVGDPNHDWAYVDLKFRVTPTAAPVPEPGTLVLVGLGFAAIGFMRKRAR